MESLPAEVLDLIAEYVHDTHEPSLYALASVSKCCRSAASAYMFRNIHINWSTPKRLDRDVDQWCKLLRHYNASKHVRRLRIDGRFSARAIGRLDPCELAELDNKNSDWPSLDEEIFGEKPRRGIFWSRLPLSQVKDSDWRPLVRLIEATPSLHDLIFDHKMQFPACLLQALHEVIPACRLHLLHFGLRSLTQSEMDPHEMAIATSPCLHAIQVHYPNCKIDSKGEDDYNEEAAMCMAAGLAPNLKRVEMIGSRTASSAALSNSHSTPRKPWSGFSKQMSNITPGTLHHLSIDEDDDDQTLEEWTRHVDFSKLKSLEFSFSIGEADLRWLISRCHFHALSELTLTLYGPSYDGFKTPTDTVSAFFSALPPLRRLDLAGDLEHMVLDALLIRHGPSLRSLTLSLWTLEAPPHIEGFEPFTDFTQSHIQQIHECCPNLEDLTLPIRRTFGKPPESLLYRTFGAFPKLRKLTLILNASSATPDGGFGTAASNVLAVGGLLDPRWDQPDKGYSRERFSRRNEHSMCNMVNSAIDEPLAQAIWQEIASHKQGAQLNSLKLHPRSLMSRCNSHVGLFILPHIMRSYLLTPDPRDDSKKIQAVELGRQARSAPSADVLGPIELKMFRTIWPASSDDEDEEEDWRQDWHSMPLDFGVVEPAELNEAL